MSHKPCIVIKNTRDDCCGKNYKIAMRKVLCLFIYVFDVRKYKHEMNTERTTTGTHLCPKFSFFFLLWSNIYATIVYLSLFKGPMVNLPVAVMPPWQSGTSHHLRTLEKFSTVKNDISRQTFHSFVCEHSDYYFMLLCNGERINKGIFSSMLSVI